MPKSVREIRQFQDSGYDSDTSSCSSSREAQLTNLEKRSITDIIRNIQDSLKNPLKDSMISEKDERHLVCRKKKLMSWVHNEIQMSERNIKVSREVTSSETRIRIERSPAQDCHADTAEELLSTSQRNTPMQMSQLSRTLSSMSIPHDISKIFPTIQNAK
jgi:hypothetical protein